MNNLFYCIGYEDTFLGNKGKPKEMTDKDWTKLNRKTISKIRQCIDNCVYQYVANETDISTDYGKAKT